MGKREGEMEIQKSEYLENDKNSLDKMKSIFHDCLKALI